MKKKSKCQRIYTFFTFLLLTFYFYLFTRSKLQISVQNKNKKKKKREKAMLMYNNVNWLINQSDSPLLTLSLSLSIYLSTLHYITTGPHWVLQFIFTVQFQMYGARKRVIISLTI